MSNPESNSAVSADVAPDTAAGHSSENQPLKDTHKAHLGSAVVKFADRHPWSFLPIWAVVFVAAIYPMSQRPLWFDELVTYYASTVSSIPRLWETINRIDFNPPLSYFTVRASVGLFGNSPMVVRLPFAIAFFGAALLLFEYFRRRLGGAFALVGIGLCFLNAFLYYSVDARPYAMLLFFFALGVLSYSLAAQKTSWSWAHTGVIVSIGGLILTHCFGPLYAASFGCGEVVRTAVTRRFDKRMWFAILVPLPLALTYLAMGKPTDLLFPIAFQPDWSTAPKLYRDVLKLMAPAAGVLICLALLPVRRVVSFWSVMPAHELAMTVCCFLTPLAIVLLAMRSHVAFWPRYGIVMIVPITLLMGSLFASLSGRRTGIALLASALLFVLFCFRNFPHPAPLPDSTDYRNLCPNLPFVVASGVNFIEMDHREPADMVKRLYYLTDHDAAVQYAHATIFEGFSTIKQWFPVRASVEPYKEFVAQHPYFIVMGDPQYPEDWLLKKLSADGAQFRDFGALPTKYSAGILRFYEVRMPSQRGAPDDVCGITDKATPAAQSPNK